LKASSEEEGENMLPTPSTSHVPYERVYEPAEDSFLFLDTLSSASEKTFLQNYFSQSPGGSTSKDSPSPLVVEVGTGSGVVLSFLHAHAESILGRQDILTAGVDVNRFACKATAETVRTAELEQDAQALSHGFYLGNVLGDLTNFFKPGQVDLLIFNPPYVPTPELPQLPHEEAKTTTTYEDDSHLLSLSYAGGIDGMETTNRLLQSLPEVLNCCRGCAYILLCAQNKPEKVKEQIQSRGSAWAVETVGTTGQKGGWEKLQILRIWRTQ
jgi:release factor glutamine methyltransferase